MKNWPDLRPILGDIPWAIVGGVATRAYMPERATYDLDIIIRAQDAPQVRHHLEAAGYTWAADLSIPGFTYRSPKGIEVDIIRGDMPWLEEALAHPHYDAAGYPVLALPYLVLLKLAASRMQDIADLARMLGQADEATLKQVRQIVSRYAPQEMEDVESLIQLGQLEVGNGQTKRF